MDRHIWVSQNQCIAISNHSGRIKKESAIRHGHNTVQGKNADRNVENI